jgi:hypothetical protein
MKSKTLQLKFIHLEFSDSSHSKIKSGDSDSVFIEIPISTKIMVEVVK